MGKPSAKRQPPGRNDDVPLLLSKLSAPVASRFRVLRNQIAERVFHTTGVKVVLIRAPAGFGKTTVMQQLRERYEAEGTPCGWLTLDEADNDLARFLTYFAAAMRGILDTLPGEGEIAALGDRNSGELAATMIERIAHHAEPFVIFMDELEALRSANVLALIAQGLDRLPPGSQVVIGTRGVPDIGLARLRARGQLLEIDPTQLRFTTDEAREFLVRQCGLPIEDAQVERLHRSTEGWVAALWLASVALQRRKNVDEFIAGFTGSNADIADYLAEDVLARQPEATREFLLQTSILDLLTPLLCDALTGRADSAALLEQIERANLFLTPVDESRSGWRYHSLFRDFLRERLRRSEPERLAALHRRASDWYLREGRPIPAIQHAFAGGDHAHALDLLDAQADALLGRGRLRLLTRWLDPLPRPVLEARPRLRAIHAWAVNFTRGPREALPLIEGFEPEQLADPAAAAQLLALRPMLLLMSDRIDESHALALSRLPQVDRRFPFACGMLAQNLAITDMILGRFAEARQHADEARRAQSGRESAFGTALADSVEAAINLMQGRLRQATVRLREAAGTVSAGTSTAGERYAFPGVLLGEALYEAGDSAAAERTLSAFAPIVRELGLADLLINAHVLLARMLGDRGEAEGALRTLAELESLGHRLALPRVIACARLERARGLIAQGDHAGARDQIEQSGDAAFWAAIEPRCFMANDLLTRGILQARWQIRSGAAAAALAPLKEQLERAEAQQRNRRALKLRILLAEALHRDGQRKPAMRMLARAVDFAAGEGFVRCFLEEGTGVQAMLAEFFQARQDEADFREEDPSSQLLRRMTQPRPAAEPAAGGVTAPGLLEALTRKEVQVLELLGQGYSNNAMAERLFVSETTVRTHLRNINVKLHASSRTQAIVIARRLQLIP